MNPKTTIEVKYAHSADNVEIVLPTCLIQLIEALTMLAHTLALKGL